MDTIDNRSGWPWEGELRSPQADRAGSQPPWLSVIIPCREAGRFLESAIRSVRLQAGSEVELIVVDGGSRDGTPEILQRYAAFLDRAIVEPDHGQSDAIAKGVACSQAGLVAWLNADDYYLPGALNLVRAEHELTPEAVLAGGVTHVDEQGRMLEQAVPFGLTLPALVPFWQGRSRWQGPGFFYPRQAWQRAGGVDPRLHYAMDYDLACRLLEQGCPVRIVESQWAAFRHHSSAKTRQAALPMLVEAMQISSRYWNRHAAGLGLCAARYLAATGLRSAWERLRGGELREALQALAVTGRAATLAFDSRGSSPGSPA